MENEKKWGGKRANSGRGKKLKLEEEEEEVAFQIRTTSTRRNDIKDLLTAIRLKSDLKTDRIILNALEEYNKKFDD